ncbi:multicopper oxidase family protein [Terrabacter terrae]|uniref:Multicopper oxidase family protein n=1 Tax=Terrabacter terrae TaxID=318434 RepID=A0ABN2U3I9_9MICO
MSNVSRRTLLLGLGGMGSATALAACSSGIPAPAAGTATGASTTAATFGTGPAVTPTRGQRIVEKVLTPRPATVDLGGPVVSTWTYNDSIPGPLIRASAGDLIRVRLNNQLPAETTVHWHGIRLANAADGVPGLTQDPITQGGSYTYTFTAPDPGTHFYHPHVGVQLDRGLYAPLIIDDPAEPGAYDTEWIIVLDDWIDGTGRTPEQVLTDLKSGKSMSGMSGMEGMPGTSVPGMSGMDHGSMGSMPDATTGTSSGSTSEMQMGPEPFGDAGDVSYPYYLVNGRVATAPTVMRARPGQRVRMRIINAAADTIFTVALGGHDMTITHSDGFAVKPTRTRALHLGMGERYDALVTVKDGVFPFVAVPFGKTGQAMAVLRTSPAGAAPPTTARPEELTGTALIGAQLQPAESARLTPRAADVTAPVALTGQMSPYAWGINGAPHGRNEPVLVREGQRVRLNLVNQTMMAHPYHVHGHTFALAGSGLRKDTVLLRPMQALPIELDADNVGSWMTHCHNIYHAEAGMMLELRYQR